MARGAHESHVFRANIYDLMHIPASETIYVARARPRNFVAQILSSRFARGR